MKKVYTTIVLPVVILLVMLQAGLLFFISRDTRRMYDDGRVLPAHYSYFSAQDFFDEAYTQAQGQIVVPSQRVYGGIIPHHLLVKDRLAAFFDGIAGYDYDTVVLIGPNHFSTGSHAIITSEAIWQTPYGTLAPDLSLTHRIASLDGAAIEEDSFIAEHSISGLVSFIKKSWPHVAFVPVILHTDTTEAQSRQLADVIRQASKSEKTLVLASVDFSHYQPLAVADFHDMKSRATIQSFDFDSIHNLEVDSAPSLYAMLSYAKQVGAEEARLLFATNSGALLGRPDEPTTSHQLYYFTKGEPQAEKVVNFLFFGDIMLDRNVKNVIDTNGFEYLLNDIAGEEQRFFRGVDVVMANLEGAVTTSGAHYPPQAGIDFAFDVRDVAVLKDYSFNFFTIANNHITDQGTAGFAETRKHLTDLNIGYTGCPDRQVDECSVQILEKGGKKIAMLGYSMVYGVLDEGALLQQIKDVRETADMVVVNIHWGVEYEHEPRANQVTLAHAIVDAGADMIIGHHPHVVQSVEVYKGTPIFYSLGNFIFDQYFSQETQEGLALGVTWGDEIFEVALFPFYSEHSQVQLMAGERKAEWLAWLSEISGLEDVEDGVIRLRY